MADGYTFDGYRLDPDERRLTRGQQALEVNARYFDALLLMVGEQGRLVTKDRFMDEVWRGIPVTDEALTQCIRNLRRLLGDDAANPRFIETVPKHGYRFIADVEREGKVTSGETAVEARPETGSPFDWQGFWRVGAAGTLGGGIAGLIGGTIYGFAAGADSPAPGVGAASMLLVLVAVTMLVALAGGAGVSFGIAAAGNAPSALGGRLWQWFLIGGALGGMIVGAVAKLLGIDAFTLLIGHAPGDITGPAEGVLLGGSIGLAAWLAERPLAGPGLRRGVAIAAVLGAGAGGLIALSGGRLMGGSLATLAQSFPESQLDLGRIGSLFGEGGFGPVTITVTAALEGALFAACVVGAIALADKRTAPRAGREVHA